MKKLLQLLALLICSAQSWATCSQPTITARLATAGTDGVSETISWTTSRSADTMVKYGPGNGGAIATSLADATGATSHSVLLTGLIPSTQYSYEVRSRAVDGGVLCVGAQYEAYQGGAISSVSFTTAAAPAGTFDYGVSLEGPKNVTQGFNVWILLRTYAIVGVEAHNVVKVVVSGLPANTSMRWPNSQDMGLVGTVSTTTKTNDTLTFYTLRPEEIEILTNQGGTTPAGAFTVTASVSGSGIPSHSATYVMNVDAAATPYGIAKTTFLSEGGSGAPVSYPAIPSLATWAAALDTYGIQSCGEDYNTPRTLRANDASCLQTVSIGTNLGAWYYDGIEGYNTIETYEGLPTVYDQCISNITAVYRDGPAGPSSSPIIPSSGAISLIMHHAQGLYDDYQRHATAADVTAIDDLDLHTYNFTNGQAVPLDGYQRETIYSGQDDYYESKLGHSQTRFGQNTTYWLNYHRDHVIGQLDQICDTQTPGGYYQSFMVGLALKWLTDYYEDGNRDARIPSIVKCTVDWLDANAYNVISDDQGTFNYDSQSGYANGGPAWNRGIANSGTSPNVLEDMLIIPAYAWLWKETGTTSYQTKGDTIWGYGATQVGASGQGFGLSGSLGFQPTGCNGSHGNGGKQFAQYIYWSDKYRIWRSTPAGSAPIVSFVPLSIDFGSVTLNSTTQLTTVLTNSGNASLTITSIGITGDTSFSQSNNCGASLAASATCTITVTFNPLSQGPKSGNVSMVDNATGSPHTVPLAGSVVVVPSPTVMVMD